VYKPATENNYDITDLHSDDDTDEEDKPRKKIPLWATGQHAHTHRFNGSLNTVILKAIN